MTQDYIRDIMQASVSSPLEMCKRLRMAMSPEQGTLIQKVAHASGKLDIVNDPELDNERAVLIAMFWRVLCNPTNAGVVLAATDRQRKRAMAFLEILAKQDIAMAAVVSRKSWYHMIFAKRPEWRIFSPSNIASVAGYHNAGTLTVAALKDEDNTTEYRELVRVAEGTCSKPSDLLIELW